MPHQASDKKKKKKELDREALVLWFEDLSSDDVALVGGKTSSLGEMYRQLTSKGGALLLELERRRKDVDD